MGNILEVFFDPAKTIKKIINKAGELSKKVTLNDMIETANFSKNNVINASNKVFGAGIIPTNNEIKDIMKVIKYLENRGILLKGTTKKLLVKKKDF